MFERMVRMWWDFISLSFLHKINTQQPTGWDIQDGRLGGNFFFSPTALHSFTRLLSHGGETDSSTQNKKGKLWSNLHTLAQTLQYICMRCSNLSFCQLPCRLNFPYTLECWVDKSCWLFTRNVSLLFITGQKQNISHKNQD